MPEIKVYFASDGRITIRWPKGQIPDRDTIERVCEVIQQLRKSPSACANMQKGSTAAENSQGGQRMDDIKMFIRLSARDQKRVLVLMQALADKDINRAAWAWLICRIAADAKGDARKVALLYVEDGLTWKQVAIETGFSVGKCLTLYKKAMAQVNAS